MRGKKLARRLDAITQALEARGIGGSFCDCPNEEGINAKRIIASRLFPEIELIDDFVETCDSHKPRPMLKPKTSLGDILLRIFPNFPPWIQSENGFATPLGSSFAEAFIALPLEERLARLGMVADETDVAEEKPLKASRFSMSEYLTQ